jgi:sortase (surface protein transpeptidase)
VQHYEVHTLSVVDQRDTRLLETPGSWLTLVTCCPLDALVPGGPLRFVAQAKPAREGRGLTRHGRSTPATGGD